MTDQEKIEAAGMTDREKVMAGADKYCDDFGLFPDGNSHAAFVHGVAWRDQNPPDYVHDLAKYLRVWMEWSVGNGQLSSDVAASARLALAAYEKARGGE